ncbi:MAG: hypothetical protein L0H79_07395 [Intrasporangium sp.]|uniref:hypothetical protein n=1 Tax=Intrasporangium sp. TaxID=1925024 RepID=UPI00264816E9|nr:hypothetical protein [Intrasporangium sp.]MDN5795563.1 hypothetical protein [Intrasporangium sp.]
MTSQTADPASTSALGGALRAQALALADLLERLGEPATHRRNTSGYATGFERDLVAAAAAQLDRIGAVLQGLATSDVERAARRRGLHEEAGRHELDIEGPRVYERPGPSRVDPSVRTRARPRVQELLNRVAASQGRDLASFCRELEASTAALRSISERARRGTD